MTQFVIIFVMSSFLGCLCFRFFCIRSVRMELCFNCFDIILARLEFSKKSWNLLESIGSSIEAGVLLYLFLLYLW